jgi:flagellar basal body-associated protein FliL
LNCRSGLRTNKPCTQAGPAGSIVILILILILIVIVIAIAIAIAILIAIAIAVTVMVASLIARQPAPSRGQRTTVWRLLPRPRPESQHGDQEQGRELGVVSPHQVSPCAFNATPQHGLRLALAPQQAAGCRL